MQYSVHIDHRWSLYKKTNSDNCRLAGFPYEKVRERTLYLQVLDYDRFSRNDPIGEVSIPLNKVELGQLKTFWKDLKPCSDGSVSLLMPLPFWILRSMGFLDGTTERETCIPLLWF